MGPVTLGTRLAVRSTSTHQQAPGGVEPPVPDRLTGVGQHFAAGQNDAAQFLGQRFGRDLQRCRSDDRAWQLWKQSVRIGVGAKKNYLRPHYTPARRPRRPDFATPIERA